MNAVPDTPLRPRREGLRRALSRFRQSRLSTVGAGLVALVLATAALGPFLAPYPDHVAGGIDTAARFLPPSAGHPFGTNELGQDVLSLTLAGASVS
ncbi:D,D-dipeptide ABC transporter permease, partial [Rhodovulum sulfidophilum]|nr:D,D-dipeptide ABC transporter permease [Rhodovulum sulfidophilum]